MMVPIPPVRVVGESLIRRRLVLALQLDNGAAPGVDSDVADEYHRFREEYGR